MIRGTSDPLYVISDPSGALVELSDGQKATIPCQFILKRNQSLNIKYSKESYYPENVTVYPTLAGSGVILGGLIDYGAVKRKPLVRERLVAEAVIKTDGCQG